MNVTIFIIGRAAREPPSPFPSSLSPFAAIVKYSFEHLTKAGAGRIIVQMSSRENKNTLFDAFAEVAKALGERPTGRDRRRARAG